MDQVDVEITSPAITARYGTLKPGDILRTDLAFAKHLVDDCHAAKYVVATLAPKAPAAKPAPKAPAAKVKKAPVRGADVCTDPPAGGASDAPS